MNNIVFDRIIDLLFLCAKNHCNNMKLPVNHILAIVFLLLIGITALEAQESRVMRYFPEGRDIVCLNGDGRYTRALYGNETCFRLETSDRPVFAVYDEVDANYRKSPDYKNYPGESYNFSFSLRLGDSITKLDETSWCKASYQGGRRTYVVRDSSWGQGQLDIYVMASFFGEGAIWRFTAVNFDRPVRIIATRSVLASTKFARSGDLGTDPREIFDAAPGVPPLDSLEWEATGTSYLVYTDNKDLRAVRGREGEVIFNKEETARMELVCGVEINTPDPFFNTIGANLLAAADGIWDGKTFLHGAVGWRAPLVGWRGAYVGDVVGWQERARSHFTAYSKSMLTEVPQVLDQPQQDPANNLARGLEKFGTPIFSNGYISRSPERTTNLGHYDMNLVFIDELLYHFCYDADIAFLRELWPKLKLHLEWEKRNFDPDNDHLYDAYCCIWASDGLYYDGGDVTHSSAYNYRANLMIARIAEILGEDPTPFREEADAILKAMDEVLWIDGPGHWAEFKDNMGLKRLHPSAALWSIYTPIDCGAGTPEQFYRATRYVDRSIPHIPVKYEYDTAAMEELGLTLPDAEDDLFTVSTTDWLPYVWSTNNVAHEEVANMALAYMQAGRKDVGFKLLKADLIDEMYLGGCPANFGQLSYYNGRETYRDFADNIGITSRALVNGLFGIAPDAMNGRCIIKHAFPDEWEEASIKTPYLCYSYRREGHYDIYEIEQNFTEPLQMIIRADSGKGAYLEVPGSSEKVQTIIVDRTKLPKPKVYPESRLEKDLVSSPRYLHKMGLGEITRRTARKSFPVDISPAFNANVDDIFRNEYLSPRWPFTTLQLPVQGLGDWCRTTQYFEIEDDNLRQCVRQGVFDTQKGLVFKTPSEGENIVYTSLWDNYPASVTIPLKGRARFAWLLLAGSTNNMQSRIENARITVTYMDGSTDELPLVNPINWCPIQENYHFNDYAFWTAPVHPYRLIFKSGELVRDGKPFGQSIPGGAAEILKMPLKKHKRLSSITLTTLSNDVVIGLMGVTLEK